MSNKISVIIDVTVDKANSALQGFKKSIAEAEGGVNKFKAGAGSALDSVKASATGFALAGGAAIMAFGAKAVDAASDLSESMNAVDVTFGNTADSIHALGETSVESFGMSERAFNDAAVQFSAFAKQVAGPGGDVAGTMQDLIGRATDFASVMNLDVNEAMQVFQSTLAGETEPIRKFGKDVSAAAVTQYALSEGLVESSSEMTESIKVQARYGLLMQQTNDVAGDFVATSDGLANSQRMLSANIENLEAKIGAGLTPVVADAVTMVNSLTSAMTTFSDTGVGQTASKLGVFNNVFGVTKDLWDKGGGNLLKMATGFESAGDAAIDYGTGQSQVNDIIADAITEHDDLIERHAQVAEGLKDVNSSYTIVSAAIEQATADVAEQNKIVSDGSKAWAEDLVGATERGATALDEFGDDAFESIDNFQAQLAQNISDTANWKDNLVLVAAQTSGEFATYLASLGPAAAGMVGDLASNSGELEQTFNEWKLSAEVGSRDMVAEFQAVDPGIRGALATAEANNLGKAKSIGSALSGGIASGLTGSAYLVAAAAAGVVNKAMQAAVSAGKIHSPSRLFAEEVGEPIAAGIAEGITEGADKIDASLTKAIGSATKSAIDAAHTLVDAVEGELEGFWGGIDEQRSEDDLRDAVDKANKALAEAVESGDADKIADAKERLEDANYRLAKATVDSIFVDGQSRESWKQTAAAAGLTGAEIDALIAKYDALALAKKNEAEAVVGINNEAMQTNQVVGRFTKATREGLFSQGDIDALNGMDPAGQIAFMKGRLNDLDRLFGNVPQYANGGVVPGPPSQGQLAVVHGGETITPAGQSAGHTTVIINAPAGMRAEDIVNYQRRYDRIQGSL